MRDRLLAGVLVASVSALIVGTGPDAKACGGCFPPPESQSGTVVTDERMVFAISQQQTTLYDQIEYQGDPASFAWVLPVKGPVTVTLSADSLFSAIDQVTQTRIVAPYETQCSVCCASASSSNSSSGGGGASSGSNVTIVSQQVVGPYATVQLKSSDPNALTDWSTANGYAIQTNVAPVIAAYVSEGYDFLAMRLVPGQGVKAMRPVAVAMPGPVLSLPLRMAAAGTGPIVGLTLWLVAEGRYEPKNFPFFVISPSELTWDFATASSNYATLRMQRETAMNNAAWQIESSTYVSPTYVENLLIGDASSDYVAIAAADAGGPDGGSIAGMSADQVREQDLATLFVGGSQSVRVTRMRADLSQAALASDMVFQASQDQSTLDSNYQVTKVVNDTVCPPFDAAACYCGQPSSGGGGNGTGSGGTLTSDAGGSSGAARASSSSSSGCAMGAADSNSSNWIEAALAGLVGLAFIRAQKKKR